MRPGSGGADRYACEGLGVVRDLDAPRPLLDASAEEALLDNVSEHEREIPAVMREVASAGRGRERRRRSFGGGPFAPPGRLAFAIRPRFRERHLSFSLRGGLLTFELRVVG